MGGIFFKEMNTQIQLTKEGLSALKDELSQLNTTKRPQLVERLAFARSQGDLSENNDYQNAREELEFLDRRIREIEDVLKNSVVADDNTKNGEISLGTTVTLKVNGVQHTYHIVGDWEADPTAKKISHTSPLGVALVGKRAGDKVEVEAPAGKIQYEILGIE
jgi:transcription elongation factor GreA